MTARRTRPIGDRRPGESEADRLRRLRETFQLGVDLGLPMAKADVQLGLGKIEENRRRIEELRQAPAPVQIPSATPAAERPTHWWERD